VLREAWQAQLSFSGARQILDDDQVTWVVQPDGGLTVMHLDTSSGAWTEEHRTMPLAVSGVVLSESSEFTVTVFGGSQIAVGTADGGWLAVPPVPPDAGEITSAWPSIYGTVSSLSVTTSQLGDIELTTASNGTFAQLTTTDWKVKFPPDERTCADGSVVLHHFFVGITGEDVNNETHTYVDFCAPPADGGLGIELFSLLSSEESRFPLAQPGFGPLRSPARFSSGSRSEGLSVADEAGGRWLATGGFPLPPEVLTTVPTLAIGAVDAPLVITPDLPLAESRGTLSVVEPSSQFELTDAGFVSVTEPRHSLDDDPRLVGPVDGQPTWGLFAASASRLVQVVDPRGAGLAWPARGGVTIASTEGLFVPVAPFRASVPAAAADGGVVLLMSSGDALYSAPLGAGVATLSLGFVPQSRANISAILALPSEPGASYSSSYLIAQGRVYRVRADNPVVWRANELTLEPAEAVALWRDGPRVRVGYRSGAVYALPSGTLVGPAQANASVALDFKNVCGHTFMLTRGGLWQLIASPGATVGTWRPVPLAATGVLAQPMGKLQSDERGLLIYRERGVVERLEGLSCLPAN
jgi:hypothetical protein